MPLKIQCLILQTDEHSGPAPAKHLEIFMALFFHLCLLLEALLYWVKIDTCRFMLRILSHLKGSCRAEAGH